VGEVLDYANDQCNLIVVSDHGHGPIGNVFYVNRWLEKQGYLVRNYRGLLRQSYLKVFNDVKKSVVKTNPFRRFLGPRFFPEIASVVRPNKKSLLDQIQIEKSQLVAISFNRTAAGLFLTKNGRKNKGILDEVEAKLGQFSAELGVKLEAKKKEDLYTGKFLSYAPDMIVSFKDYKGEIYTREFPKIPFKLIPDNLFRSGIHLQEGILMATGPDIATQGPSRVNILDIAPTMMLLGGGLKSSVSLDGKAIKELLNPEFLSKTGAKIVKIEEYESGRKDFSVSEDEDLVLQRLEDLGYL
jgi:predicted AlkP superfamily phosphohydrolase/phosphomutase